MLCPMKLANPAYHEHLNCEPACGIRLTSAEPKEMLGEGEGFYNWSYCGLLGNTNPAAFNMNIDVSAEPVQTATPAEPETVEE